MDDHQIRVIDEKDELDAKINSLDNFLEDQVIFPYLDLTEQKRLQLQLNAMTIYQQILEERINAFS